MTDLHRLPAEREDKFWEGQRERHAIHEASPHYIPSPDTGPSRLSKRVAVLVVAMVVGGIALVAWRFL
jgi:hypothetical protein